MEEGYTICAARATNEELNMVFDNQAFYPQVPKGDGYKVFGEIYTVDDTILAALDALEDVDIVDGKCKVNVVLVVPYNRQRHAQARVHSRARYA